MMTSRPASATLAIVAFCATALLVVQHQRVHRRSSRSTNTDTQAAAVLSARDHLIGAWVLTSYHVDDATTGARQYPLGHDAKGIILYTPDGHMSATLSSSNPELFSNSANMADVMKPNYPQTDIMLKRWTNYISYAGTFDIDTQSQHVLHHVEVSMFPNNVGHDQVRAYKFGGGGGVDTLQLSATFPPQNHVLLWKREVI